MYKYEHPFNQELPHLRHEQVKNKLFIPKEIKKVFTTEEKQIRKGVLKFFLCQALPLFLFFLITTTAMMIKETQFNFIIFILICLMSFTLVSLFTVACIDDAVNKYVDKNDAEWLM